MSDSDATISDTGEGGGRKVDPGFSRNIKIIGGVLAVVIVIVVFIVWKAFGNSGAGNARAVKIDQGMTTGQQKTDIEQTPAMQAKLQQIQLAESEKAQKEGRSYVPAEAIGTVEPVPPPTPMPTPTPSTMQVANSNMAYGGGMSQDQMQTIREGLRTQLAMIVPQQVAAGSPRQSLSFRDDRKDKADEPKTGTQPATASSAIASINNQSAATTIVAPLEIVAAKLANPITAIMGKPSYASATISAGPLKGAFLIGTSTLNENETIETSFTMMRVGNKAYKIDAIILDEQTADAGVKGNVDRRLLQRYVLPVALATAQGYYTAASQTGSTILAVTTGTAGTTSPPPTTDQAINAGVAAGLGIAGKEVQKAANEPIRSSVNRDMTIGILFRAAVKDEIK